MTKKALIIATEHYSEKTLQRLPGAPNDARSLHRVLSDPAIGQFSVPAPLIDEHHATMRETIEAFFSDAGPEDLLLAHFSCHGIRRAGRLYLATRSTKLNRLASTAIEADFLNDQMEGSRSRRIVLILDCCFSGAFATGLRARSVDNVDLSVFERGTGKIVITSSTALQYAYEPDEPISAGSPSVFSRALVEGLETGDADINHDGVVSVLDLFDYLSARLTEEAFDQTPTLITNTIKGDVSLTRNPRSLRAELQSLASTAGWLGIDSSQLGELLGVKDVPMMTVARVVQRVLPLLADLGYIALPSASDARTSTKSMTNADDSAESLGSNTDRGFVSLGIVARNGALVCAAVGPTEEEIISGTMLLDDASPEGLLDGMVAISQCVTDRLRDTAGVAHKIVGVGVALDAQVDSASGSINWYPDWPLTAPFPLKHLLQEATGLSVQVETTANALAASRVLRGAQTYHESVLLVRLGDYIGSALALNGKLYRGGGGISGELGHVSVERDGRQCRCGNRGCLETVATPAAILERLGARNVPAQWDFLARADSDPLLEQALERALSAIASAIGSALNVLGPDVLVIAFTDKDWGSWFGSRLAPALDEHTFLGASLPRVESIVTTPLVEAVAGGALVFRLIGQALTGSSQLRV